MQDFIEVFTQFTGSIFGIFLILFILLLIVAGILMPLFIMAIHRRIARIDTRVHSHCQTIETEALMHTKLLADIRKSLQSMEAVGIEVDLSAEPIPTPASVPQSIGPRRHSLRS